MLSISQSVRFTIKQTFCAVALLALIGSINEVRAATTVTSGLWSAGSTWDTNPLVPGVGTYEDTHLQHNVTLDINLLYGSLPYVQMDSPVTLDLGSNTIELYYGLGLNGGTITGTTSGNINTLSDGLRGPAGAGVFITDVYFNTPYLGPGDNGDVYTVSHGTAGTITWYSSNQTVNVVQSSGQQDGLALASFTPGDNSELHLEFDANPWAGVDWALRLDGDKVSFLQGLYGTDLTVSSPFAFNPLSSNNIWYDSGLDKTFVGYQAAEVSGVPEPSTFVLAALGLAGLGLVGWRKRRSRG